jgi:hypothetical protein
VYRCEATSLTGFVQQVATVYVRSGYVHVSVGVLPEGKDAHAFDRKQVARYALEETSARERMRRKRAGYANVQYLRLGRLFVLLATDGQHETFWAEEGKVVRDLRGKPLLVSGYSIRVRDRHVHVRIAERELGRLKAYALEVATKGSPDKIAAVLRGVPWQPYAPVRGQILGILRAINVRRRRAGLSLIPADAIRRRRRLIRPFEPLEDETKKEAA